MLHRFGRGFTLAEIIIAIAVAAIAIMTLATLTASVWKAAKFAKYTAFASNLGRQQLERLKGDPSLLVATLNGPPEGRIFSDTFEVDDGQPMEFQGELLMIPLPPPEDRYVRVTARVSWVQQKTPRQAVLESILPLP